MRLSEAIRLGAMVKPQAFGALLSDAGACALGGAVLAARCPVVRRVLDESQSTRPGDHSDLAVQVPDDWAFVMHQGVCPACATSRQVHQLIAHLNDEHRWTRERIADWVETIEPSEASVASRAATSSSVL